MSNVELPSHPALELASSCQLDSDCVNSWTRGAVHVSDICAPANAGWCSLLDIRLLTTTAMADIKVWYILTNKDFQPFAEPHSETFSHNRTVQVDDLKKAIIGSTKPTHFLSDVAPAELEVFTSSSLRVSDGDTFEKLEKLLNGIDKSKLEHLHPMQVPSSDQIYLVRVSKSHGVSSALCSPPSL